MGAITQFSTGLNPGSLVDGIAPGADGNLWFTDRGSTVAIGRITPSGQISESSSGLTPASAPEALVPGPDGNLWFLDESGTPPIGRITPSGQITEFSAGLNSGSAPYGITAGSDGNMWFSDSGTPAAIGRITPTGQITEYSAGLGAASSPSLGMALGADGNVWFTDSGTPVAIGEITPSGQITEYSTGLSAGSTPFTIAPGSDGNPWFTIHGNPSIGQIVTAAPAAPQTPPSVAGPGRAGTKQVCQGDSWPSWAGKQPSRSAFSPDGYQWLLDGVALAGETQRSFSPTGGEVGHELSCRATVTYPLPLLVTTAAASPPLMVLASLPVAQITRAKIDRKHHTAKFTFSASVKGAGFQCALVRRSRPKKKKGGKPSQPHFASCRSPRLFKGLKPGHYVFEVRAVTPAGVGPAATRKVRV